MDAPESVSLVSEKSGVILLYNNLKSLAKLFRMVEICLVFVFLSWTSTQLPFAVKISGNYFRQLITVIISPIFTFLVCNVIVLTILLKSGDIFAGQSPANYAIETYSFKDFINSTDECTDFINTDSNYMVPVPDEVEFQDKETIYEESKIGDETPIKFLEAELSELPESNSKNAAELKDLTRSQSDKLKMKTMEKDSHGEVRRSETERWRKVANRSEISEDSVYVFDELSNEDFQRTIETFIAKQIKFHKEEKFSIVPSIHA